MKFFQLPDDWQEQLSAEFPLSSISLRENSGVELCYLDITSILTRLDEVCGPNWSLNTEPNFPKVDTIYKGNNSEKENKYSVHAVTSVVISIFDWIEEGGTWRHVMLSSRSGVGGDNISTADVPKSEQIDKILKTAHAEAIKKAAHQFGIGRYLWDDQRTNQIKKALKEHTALPPPKTDVSLIKRVQAAKTKLEIKDNSGLEKYVQEFLSNKENIKQISIKDIASSQALLEMFVKYLEA